jgi:hypothetical protein
MKMKKTFRPAGGLLSALMATLIPTAAEAGLKYWTAGNYDADSYVQDGLVLNYDGIRNMGLNADHSTSTTTWKNLGSGGATYDLRQSKLNLGEWGEDGFDFKGKTTYASTTAFTIGTSYTVQSLIDATTADHGGNIGYVFFPRGTTDSLDNWKTFSIGVRGTNVSGSGDRIRLNAQNYINFTDITGTAFNYITAIIDVTNSWFFTGTALANKKDLASGKTLPSIAPTVWGLGGNPNNDTATSAGQALFGTIKSYRHYNRVLSEEERVWNRAVDQTRFFGAKPLSVISVTNAVIASSIASVSGNEKAGAYAVDANGYTFTAPASQTVNGRTYICIGYMIETWDGSSWSAPVANGSLSCTVSSSDIVRITWQWTAGDGIVTYNTGDYVQNGLVLNYDGIRNVGADCDHSDTTETWVNLANPGYQDLTLARHSSCPSAIANWLRDGYRFNNGTVFKANGLVVPGMQTTQVLMDVKPADLKRFDTGAATSFGYIWFPAQVDGDNTYWSTWSVSVRNTDAIWYNTQTYTSDRPKWSDTSFTYLTAIAGGTYSVAFPGTTIPSGATGRYNVKSGVEAIPDRTLGDWALGGEPSVLPSDMLYGTIKSFRFYNRVLTTSELEHNRMVDNARFFNAPPVTNVVIASSHAFLFGNEANGNYEISGSYTFAAPTAMQTDSRGFEYTFAGYTLETWNAATQGWSDPVATDGASSYTYTVGTSPAKVRLTWRWNCTKALRTVADFGLEDIVPNGLVLHYDGIKNDGADVDHNNSAKTWVNLAIPQTFTLSLTNKTTKMGCWTDCGYAFTNKSTNVGGFFKYDRSFTFNSRYSLQTLVDASVTDQCNSVCCYVMYNSPATWSAASLAIRTNKDYGDDGALYYVADGAYAGNARPRIMHASKTYSYATAIINGKTMTFFEGTEAPTSGSTAQGYYYNSTRAATATNVTAIGIGGGASSQDFTGTLKTFRYYDRVLTTDEMVRNRNVDSARYFGELATTNVFVVAGGGTQTEAEGAYKVDGEWTFTAATTVNKRGETVPVERYSVETLVNGERAGRQIFNGNSYTYTEGTSPATVRLTWLGQPLGMVIIFK